MARHWWLVFVALAGCEGGVPIEKYCDEYSAALCEGQKRCGDLSSKVDCASAELLNDDCLGGARDGVAAGTLKYDALAATECLNEISTASSCEAGRTAARWSESCQRVVTGTAKKGEPCGVCAAGLTCARGADGCNTCVTSIRTESTPLPALNEACLSPLGDGPGCQADLWCAAAADGGSVCIAEATVGESCANLPCVRAAMCVERQCVARGDLGDACGAAGCLGGLACIDGVCAPLRKTGATCGAPGECWTLLCIDGVCSRGRQLGEPCDFETPCQSRLCVDGTCAALPAPGEPCTSACAAGAYCDQGTCVDPTLQVCR